MSFIKFFVKIAVPYVGQTKRQLKARIKEHSSTLN